MKKKRDKNIKWIERCASLNVEYCHNFQLLLLSAFSYSETFLLILLKLVDMYKF